MNYNNKDLIFGLDIGTRTVIGILGYKSDEKFIIVDSEMIEHSSRAMIDGQIHDVIKVSETAKKVKENLEVRNNIELKEVVIAAAGRALKTFKVKSKRVFDSETLITKSQINLLELEGIKEAQKEMKDNMMKTEGFKYFCVGHSVVNYEIDNCIMDNLEGHKGEAISAEIICTFLPKAVVDSLYSVMDLIGLEVTNLTLEPIAAINVTIPKEIRLLNLALVDIGAGTSDIAITKNGSVIAFGMIPDAGDEITEAIVHKYLVDFNTAENIKVNILSTKEIEFRDILGNSQTVSSEEIAEVIRPAVDKLTDKISEKLLELNGSKAPNAVFCVGGGSETLNLTNVLSAKLNILEERVALKGNEVISNIEILDEKFVNGPNMITPIGICMTSMMKTGMDFINIIVNDEKLKLMNIKELTVMDAAMLKDFSHSNLIARRGEAVNFVLDGKKLRVSGRHGESAKIYVNNEVANLETKIEENDYISIESAKMGDNAIVYVSDYIDLNTVKTVYLNNRKVSVKPSVSINGKIVDINTEIKNNDIVETYVVNSIKDLIMYLNIDTRNREVYLNSVKVDINSGFDNEDKIEIRGIR
ncbi:MAG: rod shape-determining protein [Clostridia bacterium]|jgi:cell division protein FtsA|nr:rod shape-determining protein [Clostridia bacterium]